MSGHKKKQLSDASGGNSPLSELAVGPGYTVANASNHCLRSRSSKGKQFEPVECIAVPNDKQPATGRIPNAVCKVEPSRKELDMLTEAAAGTATISPIAKHLSCDCPPIIRGNGTDRKKREKTSTEHTTIEEVPRKRLSTQRAAKSTTSLDDVTGSSKTGGVTSEGIRARLRDVLTHRSISVGTQTMEQVTPQGVELSRVNAVPLNTSLSIVKGDIHRLIADAKTDYNRYEALMHSSQYRVTTLEAMLAELTNVESQLKQQNAPCK